MLNGLIGAIFSFGNNFGFSLFLNIVIVPSLFKWFIIIFGFEALCWDGAEELSSSLISSKFGLSASLIEPRSPFSGYAFFYIVITIIKNTFWEDSWIIVLNESNFTCLIELFWLAGLIEFLIIEIVNTYLFLKFWPKIWLL